MRDNLFLSQFKVKRSTYKSNTEKIGLKITTMTRSKNEYVDNELNDKMYLNNFLKLSTLTDVKGEANDLLDKNSLNNYLSYETITKSKGEEVDNI